MVVVVVVVVAVVVVVVVVVVVAVVVVAVVVVVVARTYAKQAGSPQTKPNHGIYDVLQQARKTTIRR